MTDSIFSFSESQWELFDPKYAQQLKEEYPELWALGGGSKNDYVYEVLTSIYENGGVAHTPEQAEILELRESWIKRHFEDATPAGSIAQVKWLAVSFYGEQWQKKTINEQVTRLHARHDWLAEKGGANPCWPGYKQVGMKPGKGGKMVPNCVPIKTKSEKGGAGPCWPGYKQVGMKRGRGGRMVPNCVPIETKSAKLRDPQGGLTAAGRKHFKRTEGANLKPGVKGAANTPEKMRRKGSFLTRFFTNPSGPMKDEKGRPTRLALSAAAWGEPVPQDASDAARLAAKGRRMLERYKNSRKEK